MKASSKKDKKKNTTIDGIGITTDTLTSRSGLSLFVRYLSGINLFIELERRFAFMRKNAKGSEIIELIKQFVCFLLDGTSRHLSYFDELKQDQGYAEGIETDPADMASSHTIKRFFKRFSWPLIWMFRKILIQMFIWRLHLSRPDLIVIDIDSMVMDNDEAEKRHGVSPTYKGKKGFHPIQASWSHFIIDAVFQGGKNSCNHGDTVGKMIKNLVAAIRIHYRADVPIIFTLDSGYYDQQLYEICEKLGVGYVCGGKLDKEMKVYLARFGASDYQSYQKEAQTWDYLEFGGKAKSWSKFRRAIFCRPRYEDRQQLFEFARPDTLIYTNLGMGLEIDSQINALNKEGNLTTEGCIKLYHGRGRNELVNRAFKDFGFQELPFKRFAANAAVYYLMLLSFFLFECFKIDVLCDVVSVNSYAVTVRRKVIDIAGKIVRTGGKKILKVAAATWEGLKFEGLWKKSGNPPKINWDPGF